MSLRLINLLRRVYLILIRATTLANQKTKLNAIQ